MESLQRTVSGRDLIIIRDDEPGTNRVFCKRYRLRKRPCKGSVRKPITISDDKPDSKRVIRKRSCRKRLCKGSVREPITISDDKPDSKRVIRKRSCRKRLCKGSVRKPITINDDKPGLKRVIRKRSLPGHSGNECINLLPGYESSKTFRTKTSRAAQQPVDVDVDVKDIEVVPAKKPRSIQPETLHSELKKMGMIHISIPEDGNCCYNSMATTANIHSLLSDYPYKKGTNKDIITHLRYCLNVLTEKIKGNETLKNEVLRLLAGEGAIQSAEKALNDMCDLLQSYEEGRVSELTPELWGNSSMFGFMGLIHGYKIDRYVYAISSKAARRAGKGERQASLLCQCPEDLNGFPEIQEALKGLIKSNPSSNSYIIACNNLTPRAIHPTNHFDVWLTPEQTALVNQKLSSTRKNTKNTEYSYFDYLWFPLCSLLGSYFIKTTRPEEKPVSKPKDLDADKIIKWLQSS